MPGSVYDATGGVTSTNFFLPVSLANVTLPNPSPAASSFAAGSGGTVSFVVAVSAPSPYTFLQTPYAGVFSDNGAFMMPGGSYAVTFSPAAGTTVTPGQLEASLTITTVWETQN